MALFKNMAITNKGMALYAKAQAGHEIRFSKMQVGSGQIGTQNPTILLGLLDPKLDVPITSIIANSELKSATIMGKITNKDVKEALYICELGLFAQDPDEGEILYGYVSAGQYGDYYAPESQGPYNWQYEVNAAIGNAANVTAEISKLDWDYSIINSNPSFLKLEGGNQKEINKSVDKNIDDLFNKFDKNIEENKTQFDSIADSINNIEKDLENYSCYASDKDKNGVYKVIDYKRPNNTLYMKSTLSNPGIDDNYQTDTWRFYDNEGTTIIKTVTWTLNYDEDGDIVSKVVS
ncbi:MULTISPECIES: hypothetical protein [Clostridium]|uniref:hypothetical protein n=1 Tax=Clostridium TaxID=1485 RepID=UPI000DFDC8E3|nr:hypothetical protein [Clostridium sporogenes]MCW6085504.1 hypothetical protein [Clostridium sporogenes]STC83947.1 Uncharacterised protein [Clostridium botulinum]